MLYQYIFVRILPLAGIIWFGRKNKIGRMLAITILGLGVMLVKSVVKLYEIYQGKAIFYLFLSLFPHGFFYGFSGYIMYRCMKNKWPLRVEKRLFFLTIFAILLGILAEYYWNPMILHFFMKKI